MAAVLPSCELLIPEEKYFLVNEMRGHPEIKMAVQISVASRKFRFYL
jgi:hypothetical protein